MDNIFISILNMSLTGAYIVAMIMLARFPLKRLPKIISYCLWSVAGFRFLFPFSISSIISLIPFKAAPIPQDIAMQAVPRIDSGISVIDITINGILPAAAPQNSVNPLQVWTAVGASVWLAGLIAMLMYGIASYSLLKHKMRDVAAGEDNIYEADNIQSPFLLGVISPRIYIPVKLAEQERNYVILHEKIHIQRHDYITKIIAYIILCLHWFNPFAWAAFILMGADMEMACDERALKEMGDETKRDYSLSLLSLASEKRAISGSPLAFGEGGIKERIKNLLKNKKHSRTVIITAIVLAAVLGVGFAVNRNNGVTEITFGVNRYQNIVNKASLSIVGVRSFYNNAGATSNSYTTGVIFSQDKKNVYIVATILLLGNDEITAILDANTEIPANIEKYDSQTLLGVLSITKADLQANDFQYKIANSGDSSKLQIGDEVLAVGSLSFPDEILAVHNISFPFQSDKMPEAIISANQRVIADRGSVNELNKQIEFDGKTISAIVTDADIFSGGCALMNSNSEIVGIVIYKLAPEVTGDIIIKHASDFTGDANSPKGKIESYSIPINTVKEVFIAEAMEPKEITQSNATQPQNDDVRSIEYYWANAQIDEGYFRKGFMVTNPTHKYGEALFSNTGTYDSNIRVYDPSGTLIGENTALPDKNASVLFNVDTAGFYQIIIQNVGKENIQGNLSVKTSDTLAY